jgi:hypothetical protein
LKVADFARRTNMNMAAKRPTITPAKITLKA